MKRAFGMSTLPVLLGFLAGAALMLCFGKNPIEGYFSLFQGALMTRRRLGDTVALSAGLMLTGASVALANRAGLFNIGAAGQMLAGGLTASLFAASFALPRPLMVVCVLLIGAAAGALWGAVCGALKALFGIHEVVSTIMLNWIAYWSVDYVIKTYFYKSPGIRTLSPLIPAQNSLRAAFLGRLFDNDAVNLGLVAALLGLPLMGFILNRTVLGYELRTLGASLPSAEYAGMCVGRGWVVALASSGAFAGLAGVSYFAGYSLDMQAGLLPQQGFDGIAIAIVGQNGPVGILLAGFLFGILQAGKNFMTSSASIHRELADIIVALVLWFSTVTVVIAKRRR